MLSFITSYFLPEWLSLDVSPVDSLLQGLVGACGIWVLCSLLRVHVFLEEDSRRDKTVTDPPGRAAGAHQRAAKSGLGGTLHFVFVAGVLALVGARVASLVVLEFCLRGVSGLVTAGPGSGSLVQLLVQSQFTLGCALSSSLHFLHEGASRRWLCLLLAAALSWFLSRLASRLQRHVAAVYRLHSSQRYCGVCMGLRSWGPRLMPALCRGLVCTFTVAAGAAVSIINQHFLSATEALRFWTPLTICYTLLVVHMQEEQRRRPGAEAVLNAVLVRLGGLMVLMLTVGRWADVLHILMCFLGEASCLIPTRDLLDAASSQDEEDDLQNVQRERQQKPQRRDETRGQWR